MGLDDLTKQVASTVEKDIKEVDGDAQGVALVTFGDGAIPSIHLSEEPMNAEKALTAVHALMETLIVNSEIPDERREEIAEKILNPPVDVDDLDDLDIPEANGGA